MMFRTLPGFLIAATLSGCSGSVIETAITPDLMENQDALFKISNRLEPADRAYFHSYVMNRKLGIPGTVMPSGKDPETVAAAISLMRAREARATEIAALSAAHAAQIDVIDTERDRAGIGNPSAYNAKIDQHNALVEDYNQRLKALKDKPLDLK